MSSDAIGMRRVRVGGVATAVAVSVDETLHALGTTIAGVLRLPADALHDAADAACSRPALTPDEVALPPLDEQEVWAAGVTYLRSRSARQEESQVADAYEMVYEAARPELFLKCPPSRLVAPGAPLRIRADSAWDVPEPELALVVNAHAEVVGYLVADDLSSREIEGANPLYLPQAKIFDDSLGLSGTIVLARSVGSAAIDAEVALTITRGGRPLFSAATRTAQMRRSFPDLVEYLFRELRHPNGVVLLTGTGIVPDDDITLEHGDHVRIAIEHVGTLEHDVYRSGFRLEVAA